ncbi:MAG TPA: PE family protein [Mycobacterium sp.]|nr:PE family protein [Mycobacterium sp.]
MSFVTAHPDKLSSAASNLQSITAALNVGNAAAAVPTTGVVPAAADEVSILTATQFAAHAARFQALAARALAVHELLAATLAQSAATYAATEAANTAASAL